ncbi:Hypothetical predicted protein [Octopus vulgaris]|uniref:Uncharacterized protein n=1 Tax=Octopus vulgaris TaxID=6645 RepID=A0AA36F692_OCTVU|nr:Hypothetical predicted protein [Octopus vulgaris]
MTIIHCGVGISLKHCLLGLLYFPTWSKWKDTTILKFQNQHKTMNYTIQRVKEKSRQRHQGDQEISLSLPGISVYTTNIEIRNLSNFQRGQIAGSEKSGEYLRLNCLTFKVLQDCNIMLEFKSQCKLESVQKESSLANTGAYCDENFEAISEKEKTPRSQ